MALRSRRAKADWSGCCQMAVQGGLVVNKALIPQPWFQLTGFRYFSYQVDTQLSSRGWVDPVSDPILPEKFLGYSRESNPGLLGWQSDVLTTIPNRRSNFSFFYSMVLDYIKQLVNFISFSALLLYFLNLFRYSVI